MFFAAVSFLDVASGLPFLTICRKTILASVVTRAPLSSMAPSAFVELDDAVNLFENGAKSSPRIRTGLVGHFGSLHCKIGIESVVIQEILLKLREQASVLLARCNRDMESPATSSANIGHFDTDGITVLGGQSSASVSSDRFPAVNVGVVIPPETPLVAAESSLITSSSLESNDLFSPNHKLAKSPIIQQLPLFDIFSDPSTAIAPGSLVSHNPDFSENIGVAVAAGMFK